MLFLAFASPATPGGSIGPHNGYRLVSPEGRFVVVGDQLESGQPGTGFSKRVAAHGVQGLPGAIAEAAPQVRTVLSNWAREDAAFEAAYQPAGELMVVASFESDKGKGDFTIYLSGRVGGPGFCYASGYGQPGEAECVGTAGLPPAAVLTLNFDAERVIAGYSPAPSVEVTTASGFAQPVETVTVAGLEGYFFALRLPAHEYGPHGTGVQIRVAAA